MRNKHPSLLRTRRVLILLFISGSASLSSLSVNRSEQSWIPSLKKKPAPAPVASRIDTLTIGKQTTFIGNGTPYIAVVRNISPNGPALPVSFSLYSGCDSIYQGTLPSGCNEPWYYSFSGNGPATITQLGLAGESLLEVRFYATEDKNAAPLEHNSPPQKLPVLGMITTVIDAMHGQLTLSSPTETAVFSVTVGQSSYTYTVNSGTSSTYATPNNTFTLSLDGLKGQRLTILNLSSSMTANGSVGMRDVCTR